MAGRKKGIPNRKSQELLNRLTKDHNFDIVDEILYHYMENKCLAAYFADRMKNNISANYPPIHGFTEEELDFFNSINKQIIDTLMKLLGYAYPKLKATEISAGTGDHVTFHINTAPNLEAAPPQPPKGEDVIRVKTVH